MTLIVNSRTLHVNSTRFHIAHPIDVFRHSKQSVAARKQSEDIYLDSYRLPPGKQGAQGIGKILVD